MTFHGAGYVCVGVADRSCTLDADSALFAANLRWRFRVHQRSFGGAERNVGFAQRKSSAVCLARESWIHGLQVQRASVCGPVLRSPSYGSKRHGNQVIEPRVPEKASATQGWRRPTGHVGSNRKMSASRRAWQKSGILWHEVLRNVGLDSDGRKRTHLGMLLLILRVRVDNALHQRKLDNDCPENTGLGSAEFEEATATVPSATCRRASRRRRPLPFPADCFSSGSGGDLQLRQKRLQLQIALQFMLDGGLRWHRHDERCQLRRVVGREGPLARGSYTISLHSAPVFDAQPTSSDVHNRLSITSVAPVPHCSVCDVDEAFSVDESYTIFEVDCRFDCVKLVAVKPVLMKYAFDATHERRPVFLEIERCWTTCSVILTRPCMSSKRLIPPEVERTTAKRILAVTAILMRRL